MDELVGGVEVPAVQQEPGNKPERADISATRASAITEGNKWADVSASH